jgi:tight adherence protein C
MFIEFITLAAFLGIVGLVFFIRNLVRGWRGQIGDQIAAEAEGEGEPLDPIAGKQAPVIFGEMTEALASQIPALFVTPDNLTQDLRRAGYYKPTARSEFLALRNGLAFLTLALVGVYAVMVGPREREMTANILIWGVAITTLVYVTPWIYLRLQAQRRVLLIQRALPDAFDMLTMCLTGGMSLYDALTNVSREVYFSHPDLSIELEIVRRHTDMASLGEAFQHFARRIDTPEVVALTSLIRQTERLGTNVVEAVREYADGVRIKLRQTADERANKAGVKLLFPLVLCLAPSTLIILWGPAALELRNFFRTFNVSN